MNLSKMQLLEGEALTDTPGLCLVLLQVTLGCLSLLSMIMHRSSSV